MELYFTPLKGKNAYLKGWQNKKLTIEEAKQYNGCTGVGLVHQLSNTCALDIDDYELSAEWLNKKGIDIDSLLEKHFRITSPNKKSRKIICKIPKGVTLQKFTVKTNDGKQFLEFRSGGHQDAWPGSKYIPRDMGFNEWDGGYYGGEGDEIYDLPLELVTLWKEHERESTSSGDGDTKNGGTSQADQDVHSIISIIATGGDGLHDAINKYIYMQVKDGKTDGEIEGVLTALMELNPVKDKRWQSYYDDIPRSIAGAKEKIEDEDSPNADLVEFIESYTEEENHVNEIPWPPGMLGRIAQNALDMQNYQYKELAIVSAVGLVAGICGRKFNVSGTGLNVYMTLIMPTGTGKNAIGEFIKRALIESNANGNAMSFLGPMRFTGAKAVRNSLKHARSRVCVLTEAGLLLQTKAGSQEDLARVLLSAYSESGRYDGLAEEIYSNKDDSSEYLRAPALTLVSEATPETLLTAFQESGALESGHIPRQTIIRVDRDKPYWNENKVGVLYDDVLSRIQDLTKICSQYQNVDDPQSWDMVYEDEELAKEAIGLSKYYTDIENEYRGSNTLKRAMASRMFLKILKLAGIASVVNHEQAIIRREDWEWAKAMGEYEFAGIERFFRGDGSSQYDHLVQYTAGRVIAKTLQGKYKDGPSRKDRQNMYIQESWLRKKLNYIKDVKDISDDMKSRSFIKTGGEKLIDYMVKCSYLVRVERKAPNGTLVNYLRVMPEYQLLMSDY